MSRARRPATPRRSHCPVACTLDLLGDRWTLLVVRDLLFGKHTFDAFLASPEKIATNILADRLKLLTAAGLAEKSPDPKDRRRSTYHLTPRGQALRPLVLFIRDWGLTNLPNTRLPPPAR